MVFKAIAFMAILNLGCAFGELSPDDIPTQCSLKNSFLEHGKANRAEFCQGLTLTQTDLASAKEAYVRTQTNPNDKLFWARFIKKETTFNQEGDSITIEDANQVHVIRHHISDPEGDCAAFSFDVRSNDWPAGLAAQADFVNFLYQNENGEYQVAVCGFNCHMNNRDDPVFEAETCSSLANLFVGAHDFEVVNCILEHIRDPTKCYELMK